MLRRHLLALAVIAAPAAASAQAQEVNVYSARHYDTDAQLYEAFTRATGIRVRTIQGDADQLVARIQSEGANSPADVFITVDATRLARATEAGILQPLRPAGGGCPRAGRPARPFGDVVRHHHARPRHHVRQAGRPAAGPDAV